MEADSTTNSLDNEEIEKLTEDDFPRPVRIVNVDEDGHFNLDTDALSAILLNEKVRSKHVAVLSIAGDFRKGKSFLLNFFVRYFQKPDSWLNDIDEPLKGFSWRGGSERDTTGILMWSEPFIVKTKDDREIAVLLMDTQGAFDEQSTIRESATVFALSTMTSSIQIFNILHNLQEDNLQVLDLFVEYGKLALEETEVKPFQTLMFLIRDWSYPYEFEYGLDGGDKLLQRKLEVKPTQPAQLQRVRKNLKSCFSDIRCCLMPHPGQKVATNPNFDGRICEIEADFIKNLSELVTSLVSPESLVVKSICGQNLTGIQLLEYFKAYTNIFKGETIPEPKSMLEATAEANNLAAYATAKTFYMQSMEDLCGGNKPYLNPDVLVKRHEKTLQAALDQFVATRKLGGDEFSEPHLKRLNDEIRDAFDHFSNQNKSKNMFNVLGSAFLLLMWAIFCYIVSSILEFVYLPMSNLFFIFATFSFAVEIAYMGSKLTGHGPQIVSGVDAMMGTASTWLQGLFFSALQKFVQDRMVPRITNRENASR